MKGSFFYPRVYNNPFVTKKQNKINTLFRPRAKLSSVYQLTGDKNILKELEMPFLKRLSYKYQIGLKNNYYQAAHTLPNRNNQHILTSKNLQLIEQQPLITNTNPLRLSLQQPEIKNNSQALHISNKIKEKENEKENEIEKLNQTSIPEKSIHNSHLIVERPQNINTNIISNLNTSLNLNKNINSNTNISTNINSVQGEFLENLYNLGVYPPRISRSVSIILSQKQRNNFKLNDSNPFIYSVKASTMHPFSIFYGTKYPRLVNSNGDLNLPEGKLIDNEEWTKNPDYSLKAIYKGIRLDPKVGLIIIDPVVKEKYSGLISDIIIQLLQVPFGHHMSLNVKIFEPRCLQERVTNVFSNANRYLIPASDASLSPYDRFKLVITFLFSGLYIPAQQLKPFNPFLGETFQAELPNGAKLYVEQACHKPLTARYYMFYKKVYRFYGYFNFGVRSEGLGSIMYVCNPGPLTIEFPQIGEQISGHVPEIKIVNARSQEGRANLYCGNVSFLDIKNNLKAVIHFDRNKNIFHEIKGCTFKCNYPPGYKYEYQTEWENGNKTKLDEIKSKPEFLESIEGSWLSNLIIGNKKYWDINAQIPDFLKPVKNCLPSDGRYRDDLLWLYRSFYYAKNESERKNYERISQEWKIMMEEFNRWERKRRADLKKAMGYV